MPASARLSAHRHPPRRPAHYLRRSDRRTHRLVRTAEKAALNVLCRQGRFTAEPGGWAKANRCIVIIEEGLDSPSLLILAGLSKNESLYEIEHYFKRTIEELKIELPDKRKASIELASAIIDEIHAGEKDLIEGLREIRNQVLDSYDFYTESKNYCYDSIGFEKIYGLYDSFEDLSNADYSWQLHKSNKQLMAELKEELLTELKIWNEKIKNGA